MISVDRIAGIHVIVSVDRQTSRSRAGSGQRLPFARERCMVGYGHRLQDEGKIVGVASFEPWTVEQFFAWQEGQAERYELVNGFPLEMMAGARNVHDDIVVNVLSELKTRLRGTGCTPFTGDGSVETRPGQIRRPDIGVDCGPRDPNGTKAALPRLIVEVLSPSTRDFDTYGKLDEYKLISSLDAIMLIEPNSPQVVMWSRVNEGGWLEQRVSGFEAVIDLPKLGIALTMADIYDGVEFPEGTRLVL